MALFYLAKEIWWRFECLCHASFTGSSIQKLSINRSHCYGPWNYYLQGNLTLDKRNKHYNKWRHADHHKLTGCNCCPFVAILTILSFQFGIGTCLSTVIMTIPYIKIDHVMPTLMSRPFDITWHKRHKTCKVTGGALQYIPAPSTIRFHVNQLQIDGVFCMIVDSLLSHVLLQLIRDIE